MDKYGAIYAAEHLTEQNGKTPAAKAAGVFY
jgi:hypothetical protein